MISHRRLRATARRWKQMVLFQIRRKRIDKTCVNHTPLFLRRHNIISYGHVTLIHHHRPSVSRSMGTRIAPWGRQLGSYNIIWPDIVTQHVPFMPEGKNDNAIVTNLEMKTKIYLFLLFSRDRGHTRVRALLYTRNRTFIIFIITIFFYNSPF